MARTIAGNGLLFARASDHPHGAFSSSSAASKKCSSFDLLFTLGFSSTFGAHAIRAIHSIGVPLLHVRLLDDDWSFPI